MQQAVAEQVKLPRAIRSRGPDSASIHPEAQARDTRDHPGSAKSDVPALHRRAPDHGDTAVRVGRRVLSDVTAGYNMSIASAVDFIALAGVAAHIGVVMLV